MVHLTIKAKKNLSLLQNKIKAFTTQKLIKKKPTNAMCYNTYINHMLLYSVTKILGNGGNHKEIFNKIIYIYTFNKNSVPTAIDKALGWTTKIPFKSTSNKVKRKPKKGRRRQQYHYKLLRLHERPKVLGRHLKSLLSKQNQSMLQKQLMLLDRQSSRLRKEIPKMVLEKKKRNRK